MTNNLRVRPTNFVQDLLEQENDGYIGGECSEDEEDHVSEQSETSDDDSENEFSDMENATLAQRLVTAPARGRRRKILRGINGFKWTTEKPARRSGRLCNAVPQVYIPGPVHTSASTMEEFWDLLFNNKMIDIIVHHTNEQIEDVCATMMADDQEMHTHHHLTDSVEIRAYIGLLYYSGWWKQSSVNYMQLWEKTIAVSVYRCIMPQLRFMFLSSCLRFDNKQTRDKGDKFSPIRQIWDIFIRNCRYYYMPHNNCTLDEQLLGFRGRCSFRMYIKSKPDKYGLKIISLNDAVTSYMINAIPYLGKTSTPPDLLVSEYFLQEVTTPIHNTGRTVTCDNWFSSVPIFEKMLTSYNLIFTGTIRKNKRQIPQEMKVARESELTKYCYSDDLTLLSYNPPKKKIVLLLSTLSNSNEIVQHYNSTKGGTDCFDQLVHANTVSRRTLRWPMRVFFGMLDQAAVNSCILLKCKSNRSGNSAKVTADQCLKSLYLYLTRAHLQERYACISLRQDLRQGIRCILKISETEPPNENERLRFEKRQRCNLCKRHEDNKTFLQCPSCRRSMCDKHRCYLCIDCGYGLD